MSLPDNYNARWDETARRYWRRPRSGWYPLWAEHKKRAYLGLIRRWARLDGSPRVLKTDLFPEAFGASQVLFDLTPQADNAIGVDISTEIVALAKLQAGKRGVDGGRYLCADVRHLPFRDGCVDLVISDSTLDHFPSETDIATALKELGRVLRVGGTLILTMDNKGKLGEPLRNLWIKMGLAPFYIGKTYSVRELKAVLPPAGFRVAETTAIIHQPMFFLKVLIRSLHRLSARRFDPLIVKILASLDSLEKRRTKYLTGLYVAVKAVKVGTI